MHYTITNESVTCIYEGQPYTVRKEDPNFKALRDAVLAEQWAKVPALLSPALKIREWLPEGFQLKNGILYYSNVEVNKALSTRMIRMADEGANPQCWARFWQRLQQNPSYNSVNQLYRFMELDNIPVDEEGYILAYKSVTAAYKDHHTGKFDNKPGAVHKMPRNQVSDDPLTPCHEGFHVGSLAYALEFGENRRIVICRVDPADVVSVPHDAASQKMRVCAYTVIGNYSGTPLPSTSFSEDVENSNSAESESDWVSLNSQSARASDIDLEDDDWDMSDEDSEDDYSEDDYSEDDDWDDIVLKRKPVKHHTDWNLYDQMGKTELMTQLFTNLRKYASQRMKIVGASKMGGTKETLVNRILEVRNER